MDPVSPYFEAARAIVVAEDPWGYIRDFGAPDDEYDAYVMTLVRWRAPVTAESVLAVLGDIPAATAERLAGAIEAARPRG